MYNSKIILVLTKTDLIKKEELIKRIIEVKDLYDFSSIVPISSYKDETIEELLTVLKDTLEEKDKIFNDDYFTNITEKYLVSEMIREKVLNLTKQEVPHSVGCYVLKMDFKKDKCWSCEYFCGKRDYKRGAFLGDSVSTEGRGTCSNKRSSNYNKSINDEGWCSKYQKWGVLLSALAMEEQKREAQRFENEQRREIA